MRFQGPVYVHGVLTKVGKLGKTSSVLDVPSIEKETQICLLDRMEETYKVLL